jgi:RNA polymerase sigma-70 factor (ECF subfamily)
MTKDDDIIWINQVLDGNAYAFARLVEKHQDAVFSLVRRIIRRTDEAEDVTQIVFLKAYQSLGSFKGSSLFSTWLSRIAYNTAISEYRKRKRDLVPADDTMMARFAAELQDETEDDRNEYLLQLLENEVSLLTAEDQLLLQLYYNQKHSVDQVSSIVSMTVPNVKIKLFRIRKRLLEAINRKTTQYSMS